MTDKDKIKQIQIVDVAALVNFPLIRVGKSLQSAHCPNGCVSKKGTSFSVDPEKNMFKCFSGCGAKGDVIEFTKVFLKLDYGMAVQWLKMQFGINETEKPSVSASSAVSEIPLYSEWNPSDIRYPSDLWVEKASSLLTAAHERLMNSPQVIKNIRDKWGLNVDTLKAAKIASVGGKIFDSREAWGLPTEIKDGKPKKFCIPECLLIPYYRDSKLVRVRIRQKLGIEPKYYWLSGSGSCSLFFDNGKAIWTVVESEFDGWLLQQEVSDKTNILALGSASNPPDVEVEKLLRKAEMILIATDNDQSGTDALKKWILNYFNAKPFRTPKGKDPSEMVTQSGLSVREWFESMPVSQNREICRYTVTTEKKSDENLSLYEQKQKDITASELVTDDDENVTVKSDAVTDTAPVESLESQDGDKPAPEAAAPIELKKCLSCHAFVLKDVAGNIINWCVAKALFDGKSGYDKIPNPEKDSCSRWQARQLQTENLKKPEIFKELP